MKPWEAIKRLCQIVNDSRSEVVIIALPKSEVEAWLVQPAVEAILECGTTVLSEARRMIR